jgi:hypothetical protein
LEKEYGEPILEEYEWPKNKEESESEVECSVVDD